MAEATVMEAAAADFKAKEEQRPLPQPVRSAQQRTEEYVDRHSHLRGSRHSLKETSSKDEKNTCNANPYVSVWERKENKLPATHPQPLNSQSHSARSLPVPTPQSDGYNPYMPRAPQHSNDSHI